MKKILSIVVLLALVLTGGGYALATAADAAKPGDQLYAMDQLAEAIKRGVTFDQLAKAELEADILEERADEIVALIEDGADLETIDEAVEEMGIQRARAMEHLTKVYEDGEGESKYDETKVEIVRARLEGEVDGQLELMNQVQNQYETGTGEGTGTAEAKKGLEDTLETLTALEATSDGGDGYEFQKAEDEDDTTGDGIKDRESNGPQ